MTVFWLIAVAMIALALFFLLRPLLLSAQHPQTGGRREQNIEIARERLAELEREQAQGRISDSEHALAREEIEQVLASDLAGEIAADDAPARTRGHWATYLIAVTVPLVSIAMYLYLGNPSGLEATASAPPQGHPSANSALPSVDQMVARLAERLKQNPDDVKGWRLLARSYVVMKRYPDAVAALRQARGIAGDQPDILIELADAMAASQQGSFDGQPEELMRTALQKAPSNPRVLWMAGQMAATRGEFAKALEFWERLRKMLPAEAEAVAVIDEAITEARSRLGQSPVEATAQVEAEGAPAVESEAASITVLVELDPSLSDQVAPTQIVFVYAQALSGPPMPLAVVRRQVGELPLQVRLDDSMAMMPAMKLSAFGEVRVSARISESGNAIPQPGDLRGTVEPVSTGGQETVQVVINRKIE